MGRFSVDFTSQFGAKLERKIEPRRAKTDQDNVDKGSEEQGREKKEEGQVMQGKGVEYGTQQIHMESKRFISDAKESCGTQRFPTARSLKIHMERKRFIGDAENSKDSYGTQLIRMGHKRVIGNARDSHGTQEIHMERKIFICNAKDSYGMPKINMERKGFIT